MIMLMRLRLKLLLCRSFLKDLIQVVKVNLADDVAESILRNAASSVPKPTITESLLLGASKVGER